jgi:hypothetical protein
MISADVPFFSIPFEGLPVLEGVANPSGCTGGRYPLPLQLSVLLGNNDFGKCWRMMVVAHIADKKTSRPKIHEAFLCQLFCLE